VQEAGPPASAIVEESPAPKSGGPADAVPTDPGGSADGIGADLDGLRDVWPAVLDHLKTTNMLCASILAESRPVALQAGELTVAFPPGSEFLRRRADSEAYRACVIEALRAVTGQAPTLAYELRELEEGLAATGGGDGVGAGAVPRALTEDEWVARFVTEFDAEEIIPEAPPEETA
jgi:hypothetical protein